MSNTLERLLPYAAPIGKDTYGWPWASKTSVPCVASTPLQYGTLVYNPQNKNVKQYNQRASELTPVEIYGLAVIICPTEDAAVEAVDEVNESGINMGPMEKMFTITGRALSRLVGRRP